MVGADLVRCATLVPVALAGLSGSLPLWGLIAAAFALEAATSYFAYGATIPAVVDRDAHALAIGGWALAAALLTFLPLSTFFAVDAATFLVSALLIARLRAGGAHTAAEASPRLREGIAALRPRRSLSLGVVVFAVAMTITTGSWIAGVPTFVRDTLHRGPGAFSLVMIGFALGGIVVGGVLARVRVRAKARASMLAWLLYLPAYGLIAVTGSLPLLVAAAVGTGAGETIPYGLLNSAAQEEVPDAVLECSA